MPDGLTRVVAIAAGGRHSLALIEDGTVLAWGSNSAGQASVPQGLMEVVAIAAGYYHSVALIEDGTVVAWGSNQDGQASVPQGLMDVVAIAAGRSHSLALKRDGTVVAWGRNSRGESTVPENLRNVVAIAADEHSLAIVSRDFAGPPSIWAHPRNQSAILGGTALFRVDTSEPRLLSRFQWYKDGIAIPGATRSFLVISGVGIGDAGHYHATVLNEFGSSSSRGALLTVITYPVIASQPRDPVIVDSTSAAFFDVTALGAGELHYQWHLGGNPIAGATNNSLDVTVKSEGDLGPYQVEISNTFGSPLSDAASITITSPLIISQPEDQNVAGSDPALFGVVALGAEPLVYQWFLDGFPIAGATADTFETTVSSRDALGLYQVEVSNESGSVLSEPVMIAITSPLIISHPPSQAVDASTWVYLSVVALGAEPLTYQWFLHDDPIVDAIQADLRITSFKSSADLGPYRVQISNGFGSIMSNPALIAIGAPGLRLAPSDYWPGRAISITLAARPQTGTTVYAVDQVLPELTQSALIPVCFSAEGFPIAYEQGAVGASWEVASISHGGRYEASANKVLFGLFFDSVPRDLTFTLLPPLGNAAIIYLDSATLSEDGHNRLLHGVSSVYLANHHPADNNAAQDWRLTIHEVTAYASAWQRSLLWAVPPNPPPIDYMTRAGCLGKNGDYFRQTNGLPPLWWTTQAPDQGIRSMGAWHALESVTSPAAQGDILARLGGAGRNLLIGSSNIESELSEPFVNRIAPVTYEPKTPFSVTVESEPGSATVVYAIEELIPDGCEAVNVSPGGTVDAINRKVKWGPFFSNEANRLSYQLIPEDVLESPIQFAGTASFDGSDVEFHGATGVVRFVGPYELIMPRFEPGTQFGFGIQAPAGITFTIEASMDLRHWTPISTQAISNVPFIFQDFQSTNQSQRFYRFWQE